MNYATRALNVPQSQPIPGQTMIKNSAGGYTYQITDLELVKRFCLLGTEGGTYYATEAKLTQQNATEIIRIIRAQGEEVVKIAVDILLNQKAPKTDPSIFTLALCSAFGDAATKKATYDAIPNVCNTATHLFFFVNQVNQLRGWSRGLRRAVANWYLNKSPDKLAYQIVKYRSRHNFTHMDVLRLAHAKTDNKELNAILKYAVGKNPEVSNKLIQSFESAQKCTSAKDIIPLIKEAKLTWEMVPTQLLNDGEVLKALLPNMPLTALVRNLNRFSTAGLTGMTGGVTSQIVARFNDEKALEKFNMHPVMIANSMLTYQSGHGDKSSKTWSPNANIVAAMQDLYVQRLNKLTPTGKKFLIGCDVSGSMNTKVSGMNLEASKLAQVLALTMLKTEKEVTVCNFDTNAYKSTLNKHTSLESVLKSSQNGGGTDCSIPIRVALGEKFNVDCIVIITDNETWAGQQHSSRAIQEYREKVNKDVKIVEIALTATPHTQLPQDKNFLRVVGFDATVVDVINQFLS